jgi:CelD/BcsL family acetyltransferase involved in cellulose biosynthesis
MSALPTPIEHDQALPRMKAKAAAGSVTFQTICNLAGLESVREVWNSWQKTRDSNFDFFCGVVRSRGEACSPHVLVLLRDGRPDALLVGFKERRRILIRICSVAVLQPELEVLEFVRGGLLGNDSAENSRALVQTVMKSLAGGAADLALWEYLEAESPLHQAALRSPSFAQRDHCRKFRVHWFLDQPKGREAFFKNLERSQRSKLRRKYKKFLDSFAGRIEVRSFQTVAELDDAVRDMEEIARKSVKRQLGFGFFNTPRHREQLLVEAALGWLRVFVLYVDGAPVSFWKGTLYEWRLHADHVGFDSAWSDYSPGIFLFLEIIERLRDADMDFMDFGTGAGQFYESFAKVRRPEARVQIFAPKLRGIGVNVACTLAYRTTQLIQRTSWLDWVRKVLWKVRRSALEAAGPMPEARKTVKSSAPVLSGGRH